MCADSPISPGRWDLDFFHAVCARMKSSVKLSGRLPPPICSECILVPDGPGWTLSLPPLLLPPLLLLNTARGPGLSGRDLLTSGSAEPGVWPLGRSTTRVNSRPVASGQRGHASERMHRRELTWKAGVGSQEEAVWMEYFSET